MALVVSPVIMTRSFTLYYAKGGRASEMSPALKKGGGGKTEGLR